MVNPTAQTPLSSPASREEKATPSQSLLPPNTLPATIRTGSVPDSSAFLSAITDIPFLTLQKPSEEDIKRFIESGGTDQKNVATVMATAFPFLKPE